MLLADFQDGFGGPRAVMFPDIPGPDYLTRDLDGSGHTIKNALVLDRGGAVFNVRSLGAVGDGVTDDTAAFEAALDLAGAVAGGVVFAPPSFPGYVVNLDVDQTCTFKGAGNPADGGSQLITLTNAPILNITARCTVEGLAFKGTQNPAFTNQDLIRITDTNDVKMRWNFMNLGYRNVRVVGTCFCIDFDGVVFCNAVRAWLETEGASAAGCEIELNHCRGQGGDGGTRTCGYGMLFNNLGSLTVLGGVYTHSAMTTAGIKVETVASGFGGIEMTGGTMEIEGPPGRGPALWLAGTSGSPIKNTTVMCFQLGGSNVSNEPIVQLDYVTRMLMMGGRVYGAAGARGIKFTQSVTRSRFIGVDYDGGNYQFIADTAGTVVDDLYFELTTTDTTAISAFYFHAAGAGVAVGNITIRDCELGNVAQLAANIDRPDFTATGKRVLIDSGTYNKGVLAAPAVPATNIKVQNNFDVPLMVRVIGTITNSFVNNVSTGSTSTLIPVPAGGTIALSYSSLPTWSWIGM